MELLNTLNNVTEIFKLILISFLFLPLNSFAVNDYITVSTVGKTVQEAKHRAFTQAIEQKVGVILLSDRETSQFEQTKNDIYAYSAGYVIDYKIISEIITDDAVRLTVDVKVDSSKIKNRILADIKDPDNVPGEQLAASLTTYENSSTQAYRLLDKILSKYPNSAYTVEITDSSLVGNGRLRVNFSVVLNNDFVDTLEETLSSIENTSGTYVGKFYIHKRRFTAILDTISAYYIESNELMTLLYTRVNTRDVRVKITFKDNNKILYSECNPVDTFIKFSNSNINVYKGTKIYYYVDIYNENFRRVLDKVNSVTASAVSFKECYNEKRY